MLAVLCASLLLLAANPATAQWLWRGADGRLNASDRPPPAGVAEKDIVKRPTVDARRNLPAAASPAGPAAAASAAAPPAAPASAASAPAASSAAANALEKQVQAKKRALEEEKARQTKAEAERAAAIRQTNCRQARSQTATLESGIRVTRTNERGEREFLDDRARAEELRRAREIVASDCR